MPTLRHVSCLLLLSLLALSTWTFWWEPDSLKVRHYALTLPHWPQTLTGLRIAILTDLHLGAPYLTLDKLATIVTETNKAHPDIILLLGDFMATKVLGGIIIPPKTFAPLLAKLQAPLGTWAVLGNHDHWYDATAVTAALHQAGIPVLSNQTVSLTFQDTVWGLCGFADWMEGHPDIPHTITKAPPQAPLICMTHNPDIFPNIPKQVTLLVAGHTHGGQINLPFIGPLIVPSQYGSRYAKGYIQEGHRHLFVSPGLGTSILPGRLRVPPEISLLTLSTRSNTS